MSNKAAWLTAAKAKPFKVDDAPMPSPAAHEVVIRSYAAAINPVDMAIQEMGILVQNYPAILGCDVAGEITAVGDDVKNFKLGDRVLAEMDGNVLGTNTNNGFQMYCATSAKVVAKLPNNLSYAQGCVLPLGFSTAAVALFKSDCLGLPLPQLNPKPTGKVVLVWGGSSSVGSCGIQLIKAAGFEVATTASAKNREYCAELGAKWVFDYTKDTVVDDVVEALNGEQFAGVFAAIFDNVTIVKSAQIAGKLGGKLATVAPPGHKMPEEMPKDVETSDVYGLPTFYPDFPESIWGEWLPSALADGSMKCKPDPVVVGQGLESFQAACDRMKAGVSAAKLVVELP